MGMASIASLSLGTPASISFRLEAESAAYERHANSARAAAAMAESAIEQV